MAYRMRCPKCGAPVEFTASSAKAASLCPACGERVRLGRAARQTARPSPLPPSSNAAPDDSADGPPPPPPEPPLAASADVPSAAVSEQAAPESSADEVPPRPRQTFWLGVGAGAVALVLVLALGAGAIFLARRWISEGSAARPSGSPPAAPSPAAPSPAAPAPSPAAPPPGVAVDPPYTCEHAAELIDQRRYAEAMACLDKIEGTAGPSADSERWRLASPPYSTGVLGERHLYLFSPDVAYQQPSLRRVAPDARPPIVVSPGPASAIAACVDIATGKQLWVRRLAGIELARAGPPDLLDPVTDDLYLCGNKVVAIDAETGEASDTKVTLPPDVLYFDMFPGANGRSVPDSRMRGTSRVAVIAGIAHGGECRFSRSRQAYTRRTGSSAEPSLLVYDAESQSVKTVAVQEADGLAGGLRIKTKDVQDDAGFGHVITACGPSGAVVWTYRGPYHSGSKPIPAGGDVYALDGAPGGPSEVVRLDGQTGVVKWRFEVPGGAGGQALATGHGLAVCGYNVVALGAGGRIFVLDAASGQLTARLTVTGRLTFQPEVRGDLLLVGTDEAIRGLPLAGCAAGPARNRAAAAALRATALTGLGKTAEAMLLLAPLLEQAPDLAETWRAQAEICEKMNWTTEAQTAWLRHMVCTHQVESPRLRASSGLLKLIPAGRVTADPVQIGDAVYFGSCTGSLLAINAMTLEMTEQKVPLSVVRLGRKNGQLVVFGADKSEQAVRAWGEADAPPTDPAQLDVDALPPDWRQARPFPDPPVFRVNGKLYSPSVNGAIIMTDDGKRASFRSKVPGINGWRLYLAPQGPLGYDNDCVYALDENLCPASRILNVEPDTPKVATPVPVTSTLASDGQTICFVTSEPEAKGSHARLQIWSADGKSKLREEPLVSRAGLDGAGWKQRLFPVAGGYLLAESQLVWVSALPDARVWRFGGSDMPAKPNTTALAARTAPRALGARRGEVPPYTLPAIARGKLFVGYKEGILVFDLDHVAARGADALETPAAVPQ